MRVWHSIGSDKAKDWNEISLGIIAEGLRQPGHCPSCKEGKLRFFFSRYLSGRAGYWIWCPSCLTFEHRSVLAPDWWQDAPNIPPHALQHNPEWIENHWDELAAVSDTVSSQG